MKQAARLSVLFLLAGPLAAQSPEIDEEVRFLQALETGTIAQGRLSDGLPGSLPLDYLDGAGLVPFKLFRERPRAPLAVQVFINDRRADARDMHRVFAESVLAGVPDGTRISESTDAQGRAVWSYPLNTTVAHYVTLKSRDPAAEKIFELRIARKVEERRWAFGVYRPEGGELRLQTYAGFLDNRFTLLPEDGGEALDVRLKHVPLETCRNCHANTTAARYQYPAHEEVGPCEFTPPNPHVRGEWAPAFESARGFAPFGLN